MIEKIRDGKDRRILKRRHLLFYLEITNKENGDVLGNLGDITVDGLMILSSHPFPIEQKLEIYVNLPKLKEFDHSKFESSIETMWCHPDFNPKLYCTGCQFILIDNDVPLLIQHLIRVLAFSD